MIAYLKQFVNTLNKPRNWLILANILLVFLLILLSNLKVLPMGNISDFLFLSFLFLAFALYRPGWAFLFFIGTIALENISLAPESLGIAVRPYQFFAALIIVAVLVRLATKRLNFKLPKFYWVDGLLIIFAIAGFLSALGNEVSKLALKQSVIALSFVAIYFLVRIFIQNTEDLKKIIPFFLSSSIIVVLYGIWQNIRFSHSFSSFETMPGRPNGTFTEADWLGIYLVLLLAIIYSMIYFFSKNSPGGKSVISDFRFPISNQFLISKYQILKTLLFLLLTTVYILLILTVSRSAWLGALVVTILYLLIIFTNLKFNPREWQWKNTLKIKLQILSCIIVSVAIVYFFNLTSFQLLNRVQSTKSGLQKITVACPMSWCLVISGEEKDLQSCNCYQINLEDIEKEKAAGQRIEEVYRKDPNISIRSEIYQKSWQQIKAHPILGIGWGNIGEILGRDGRGAVLNSSNIFLEIWLGAGISGLASFLLLWSYIIVMSFRAFYRKRAKPEAFWLFLILAWIALTIPNLFNAGIFLGLLWIFSGVSISLLNYKEE
ncbi:MAG: O-antigen ligase family protein [Parcubacteria group bacterium]